VRFDEERGLLGLLRWERRLVVEALGVGAAEGGRARR